MDDSPATRQSLVLHLRDLRDGQAWGQFVEIYSPFVYHFLRRRGLQDADAVDVSQEVLRTVVRSIDDFQPQDHPRSFRKWLISIARSRLCDFAAQRQRQTTGSGDTEALEFLKQQPASGEDDERLEQEYQRCLFQWAAEKVRGQFEQSTWQAFWLTYVQGQSCQAAADALGISLEAVYMARSRVLARLRKKIQQAEKQSGPATCARR